jgi:sarcosine oxidase
MPSSYDVAVIGMGAMGSAAAYRLAERGLRVLGLDRFRPPHQMGSSHGGTRIIREAYFEDPRYVPLVQRAYDRWTQLEADAGVTLLRQTGGLMIGPEQGEVAQGAQTSAVLHGLDHEVLSAKELRRRFPAFNVPDGQVGVWEPRAGILFPERCVEAQLSMADGHGAELRFNEPLGKWMPTEDGFHLRTSRGEYWAERLVVTAGSWFTQIVGRLGLPLRVTRQHVHWFAPPSSSTHFEPALCPVYIWEQRPGDVVYGFPDVGEGFKLGLHEPGPTADPDTLDRTVTTAEVRAAEAIVGRCFPEIAGSPSASEVCLYTNTADGHFLIDRHPKRPNIVLAGAGSGHGFKFASVIGEIVADLVIDGRSEQDIDLFGVERLLAPKPV